MDDQLIPDVKIAFLTELLALPSMAAVNLNVHIAFIFLLVLFGLLYIIRFVEIKLKGLSC